MLSIKWQRTKIWLQLYSPLLKVQQSFGKLSLVKMSCDELSRGPSKSLWTKTNFMQNFVGSVKMRNFNRKPFRKLSFGIASNEIVNSERPNSEIISKKTDNVWSVTANGRWRLVAAQLSIKFGYCPSCPVSMALWFHKNNLFVLLIWVSRLCLF